jgi:dTDP-4-dehydrorhamnose reductase
VVLERIFLTGGSGTLGSEMINRSSEFGISFVSPSSNKCDITNYNDVREALSSFDGDIVVHAAAETDVTGIERSALRAIEVNVVGTINIIRCCQELNKRLVFISTDYVFDGLKGDYTPKDPINPISKYAKTKASAELLVRSLDDYLVIRTSFFGRQFPYDKAVADQWSTKDYVDIIAPLVLEAVTNKKTGILHIGTEKSTTYDKAKKRKPEVQKIYLKDINFSIPRDVSLEVDRCLS